MDESDDPYEILGVPVDADAQQIRSAYRKAALRYHPDKQNSEEDKAAATVRFSKISNAYECLSDEDQRRQYDMQRRQGYGSSSFATNHAYPPEAAAFSPTDFFHSRFHQSHPWHDPFQVFEQFFREDFGGPVSRQGRNSGFFEDPFMGGSMMGGGGMMDPFGGSMFGGGGQRSRDPFGDMFASMRQMQDVMNQQGGQQLGGPGQSYFYSSSSSTNTMGGAGNGASVSTQTTTRIVNGKQQIVIERVIHKADGTVERVVETSGDEDFHTPASATPLVEADAEQQSRGFLPWRRSSNDNAYASGPSEEIRASEHFEEAHVSEHSEEAHPLSKNHAAGSNEEEFPMEFEPERTQQRRGLFPCCHRNKRKKDPPSSSEGASLSRNRAKDNHKRKDPPSRHDSDNRF